MIKSLQELDSFAEQFLKLIEPDSIVLLSGDLGAGKTTFVQFCGKKMQVKAAITSPTFNLLNQYRALLRDKNVVLFHLDLYRLKGNDNAIDLDFTSLAKGEHFVTFIEWPEKVKVDWSILSKNIINLQINVIWPEKEQPDVASLAREIKLEVN